MVQTEHRASTTTFADQTDAERLELVMRATNDGLWDWDLTTNEVYLSPRWKEMLGYAEDEFAVGFGVWRTLLHPDDRARAVSAIKDYLAGTTPTYELDHRLRHKDGSYRWIHARGVVARDDDGRPIRFVGSHTDITARKTIEQDLVRRDAIFAAVTFAAERFLSSGTTWEDCVGEVLERLGRAADVSRVYVFERDVDEDGETWLYLRSEWVAPGIAEPQRERPDLSAFRPRALGWTRWGQLLHRGELVHGRTCDFPAPEQPALRDQDVLSIALVPIFVNRELWGIIGFDECMHERDFSEMERDALKAAADTLGAAIGRDRAERASTRLAAIVESSDDAIIGATPDGIITSWNPGAARLFGYAPDEAIGQPMDMLLPVEDHPSMRELLFELSCGTQCDHYETDCIKKDGTSVTVSATFSSVHDANGALIGASAIVRDITERKRAEQELLRRDAILEAVTFAAGQFLGTTTDWTANARAVLERLGRAADASRVYVFENYLGDDGELWATNTHEWVAPGVESQIDDPLFRALPYNPIGFGRFLDVFRRGEATQGHVRDVPSPERSTLVAKGTLSYLLVPIFVDEAWWGVIGFDECTRERSFSSAEQDALKAAADTLGAAIGRDRLDANLREKQRAFATLVSNLPGMAYRCRNEPNWTMTFVSEGCHALTGYPGSDLLDNHRMAYVDIIHPDDRAWVWRDTQRAITADEPYRLTYRITTADGVEKWALDQGRAVRDDGGAVVALEGFISDVTDRVQARQLLEQRVAERTRELATLLDISTTVASTLELQPLLEIVLDQLQEIVEYSGASLCTLDGADLVIVAARSSNPDLSNDQLRGVRFPNYLDNPIWHKIQRHQPVIIDDVWDETELARAYRTALGPRFEVIARNIRAWLAVPLAHKDRLLGMLTFSYPQSNREPWRHAELAMALAGQAALAIENARLYEQVQANAVLEERQRLARELHDSVSQALYGIGLGAAAVRSWLDTDPARATEPADYVLSLAEAGLAEMRALIFELRPESLAEEGLVAALAKQAASLRARHELTVVTDLGEEPDVSLEVKEVFYRIAQEALHNTVKHARATTVEISLAATPADIALSIRDDGRGFDATSDFPGHLGLRSMRERIERLGGTLQVESEVGHGTRIRAQLGRV